MEKPVWRGEVPRVSEINGATISVGVYGADGFGLPRDAARVVYTSFDPAAEFEEPAWDRHVTAHLAEKNRALAEALYAMREVARDAVKEAAAWRGRVVGDRDPVKERLEAAEKLIPGEVP